MPGVCWIQNWGYFDVRWHTIHWQVITLLLTHFFGKAIPLILWITAPCIADALMLHTAVVGDWICLTAMLKLCTLACRKNLHLCHPTPGEWLSSCSTTDCPVYFMAALALPKHLHHIRPPLTENEKASDVATYTAILLMQLFCCINMSQGLLVCHGTLGGWVHSHWLGLIDWMTFLALFSSKVWCLLLPTLSLVLQMADSFVCTSLVLKCCKLLFTWFWVLCYLNKTLFAGYTQVMIMEGLSQLFPMKKAKAF